MDPPAEPRGRVAELATVFLRLGLTAVGGPAAHIALFREALVRRRRWLDDRDFAELLAASNLIPGPTSTELAMHLGYRRAGWPGLVVAGVAFAAPAVAIVLAVAWGYATWGTLPEVGAILAGIAPVVVAIVAHATVVLGRSVLVSPLLTAIAAAAVVASLAGVPDLATLAGGGLVGLAASGSRGGDTLRGLATLVLGTAGPVAAVAGAVGLGELSVAFLKIGAVLFGSGYLLVALLDAAFVDSGLLSQRQLLDAVAVGQFTPGPVFTTATFVGYLLLGLPGAIVATLGIALPAFGFVALSIPVLDRLRRSIPARAALAGVSAAVVGLLAAVTGALWATAVVDLVTAVLAIGAFALLVSGRIGPAWLLLGGGLVGIARAALAG